MRPQDLITAFETVAEAPDGVKRLRELVLQLAVRGKLVPQDPNDEDARQLLARLRSKNPSPNRRGNVTEVETRDDSAGTESALAIPSTWCWVRFGEICETRLGKMLDKAKNKGPLRPYLRNANLQWFRFDLSDVLQLRLEDGELAEHSIRIGDLLICEGGEPGRAAVCDKSVEGMVFQKALHRARPRGDISAWYLAYLLRYDTWSGRIQSLFTGATIKHLTGQSLAVYPVPLPPLAEQHRIVAKVDELMGLLDRLEAAHKARNQTRTAARDAALAALRDAADSSEVEAAWTRVASQMPELCLVPEDVKPFRQAVLELAVRGRLVPQDPRDEAASEFLAQIEGEKASRASGAKRGVADELPAVGPDERSYPLPASWDWCRFGRVSINRDAERVPVASAIRTTRRGKFDYYGASGAIDKIDDYLFDGSLLLVGEDGANLVLRSTPIAFIAEGQFWVNNHAHVLDSVAPYALRYLAVFLNAIDLKPFLTGIAQPKLNQARMNMIPCAVPPLAEQKRIVAKVEELTAILDRLEAQLTAARTSQEAFASAAVAHLDEAA